MKYDLVPFRYQICWRSCVNNNFGKGYENNFFHIFMKIISHSVQTNFDKVPQLVLQPRRNNLEGRINNIQMNVTCVMCLSLLYHFKELYQWYIQWGFRIKIFICNKNHLFFVEEKSEVVSPFQALTDEDGCSGNTLASCMSNQIWSKIKL